MICQYILYCISSAAEQLRHTNAMYGRAVPASVALRRLASWPDCQNAAWIRRIGGTMPSGTLGPL
eukprot:6191493-Pleurochrysis_carterae.AAC.1